MPAMNEHRRSHRQPRQLFLVERFWPGVTPALADTATARIRAVAGALAAHGAGVRHLRSDLLPADEVVVSIIEAASLSSVVAVHRQAGYPADRISEAVSVGRASRRAAR